MCIPILSCIKDLIDKTCSVKCNIQSECCNKDVIKICPPTTDNIRMTLFQLLRSNRRFRRTNSTIDTTESLNTSNVDIINEFTRLSTI
jgi:hypothetical protein